MNPDDVDAHDKMMRDLGVFVLRENDYLNPALAMLALADISPHMPRYKQPDPEHNRADVAAKYRAERIERKRLNALKRLPKSER